MSPAPHVLVTGGAGFIGSHLVDLLLEEGARVTVLDKLTYAGNLQNLSAHGEDPRLRFVRGDVADPRIVDVLVAEADQVVHAAAESFVDRSIADARAFVLTNVLGTQVILQACRRTSTPLLYVSTDEVYGTREGGVFTEEDPLRPSNPYAASKAAGELLCRSYSITYGLPVTIVRGTNAYGPRQNPEKGLPTYVLAALEQRQVPVYGDGSNVREWLHVADFARGLLTLLHGGEAGATYNLGGGHELANIELARLVCGLAGAPESLIEFVPDRPGHDLRYGMGWDRLAGLGWRPGVAFEDGLVAAVDWYRENPEWVRAMRHAAVAGTAGGSA